MTDTVKARVREATSGDLIAMHAINQAATPGVGAVSVSELALLVEMAWFTLVAEQDGAVVGFILCMTEGAPYASPNYQWIEARYPKFAYCDRIAIRAESRGLRLGEALYAAACSRFKGSRTVLTCEVNLSPPNPGSLRFHERLGFCPIGERWNEDRSKGVVYLAKALS